jgi:hypothetical protein
VKLAIALLGIAIVVLVGILHTQSSNIRELQSELADLNAKLAERSKADELEAKCAEQAGKLFDAAAYAKSEFAAYTSRYNPELDKCVVRVLHTDSRSAQERMIWAYVTVLDASDNKPYGTYAWHTVTSKKFLIVPPATCEVTLPTGEQRTCRSINEFEELVKVYMEGR